MDPISKTLVAALHRFVAEAGVPLIDFMPGQRKDDIAKAFLADFDGDERWAKRQAAKAGVGFEALDDGFLSCADPAGLQRICDRLTASHDRPVRAQVAGRVAAPFTAADRPCRLPLRHLGAVGR